MSCESYDFRQGKNENRQSPKSRGKIGEFIVYIVICIFLIGFAQLYLRAVNGWNIYGNIGKLLQSDGKKNWVHLSGNDGKFWRGMPDDGIYADWEGIECTSYYKYSYDRKGRLAQVDIYRPHAYYPDTWVLSDQEVYLYDDQGRVTSRTLQSSKWVYEYSAEGYTVTYYFHHSGVTDTYTYDEQDNMISKRIAITFSNPHEYFYTYDEKNREIKEVLKIGDDEPYVLQTMEYDDGTNTALEKYYNWEGKLYGTVKYESSYYDGLLMEELSSKEGSDFRSYYFYSSSLYYAYDYNDQGNCILQLHLYEDGDFFINRYVYDRQGRKTEEFQYNCSEANSFERLLTDGSTLSIERDEENGELFCVTRTASDGKLINRYTYEDWLVEEEPPVSVEDSDNLKGDTDNLREDTDNPKEESDSSKEKYQIYIVRQGDCLWEIAERYLGDGNAYMEIYRANEDVIGDNPNLILPGMELYIEQTVDENVERHGQ